MQQRSLSVAAVPLDLPKKHLGPARLAVQHKKGCAYGRAAIKLGRGCAKVGMVQLTGVRSGSLLGRLFLRDPYIISNIILA